MSTESQELMPTLREQAVIERGLAMDATTFDGVTSVFSNGTAFQLATKMAQLLAGSTIMPEAYQDNPANCLIAIDYAARLNLSPVMLAQNMDVVKGKPGLRGTLLAAIINACPLFSRLKYEWKGEPGSAEYGCRAYATELETGDVLLGSWVTWQMVKSEGWDSNKKWTNLREQMFMYRAASFWSRAHASDVTLGLYESEELRDMDPAPKRPERGAIGDLQERLIQRAAIEHDVGPVSGIERDREELDAVTEPAVLAVDPDTGEVLPEELQ